jgi:hypothetical protein
LESHPVSFENTTGELGSGGQVSNDQLGLGRKGFAANQIQTNEKF